MHLFPIAQLDIGISDFRGVYRTYASDLKCFFRLENGATIKFNPVKSQMVNKVLGVIYIILRPSEVYRPICGVTDKEVHLYRIGFFTFSNVSTTIRVELLIFVGKKR